MKPIRLLWLLLLGATLCAAQTVVPISFNDAGSAAFAPCVPGGNAPCKVGENIGTPGGTDSANGYQNLFGTSNWGFEQSLMRQIFAQGVSAAANQVVTQPFYTVGAATYPADLYAGYHVDITAAPYPFTGAEAGCSQTVLHSSPYAGIASNTTTASFSITSNVVTIVATNSYQVGEVVAIGPPGYTGFATGTYLNGVLLTITSATSSQFTAAFTHANVASTADAGAQVVALEVLTLASNCGAATQNGDIFVVTSPSGPTPASAWAVNSIAQNGATYSSDTTTPYDGSQSLLIDTTASGSFASYFNFGADNNLADRFRDINGTWSLSIYAKAITGTGHFSLTVARALPAGGSTTLCTGSFTAPSTWTQEQVTCTPNEDTTLPAPGLLTLSIVQSDQTKNDYDDLVFVKTSGRDATNTTPVQDETLAAEAYFDGGTSATIWGVGRAWEQQTGETFANWIKPASQAALTASGDVIGLNSAQFNNLFRLQDILKRFQREHRIPYFVVPITFTNAEAISLISYLTVTQSGMTQPWVGPTGVFPIAHLSLGNENWNNGFFFGGLPSRTGCVTAAGNCYSVDYLNRAGGMAVAMRSSANYISAIKLVLNVQQGFNPGITNAQFGAGSDYAYMVARGGAPDEFEVAGYKQLVVTDFDTVQDQWAGALEEPWDDFHNTGSGVQQQFADLSTRTNCGASGTALCKVNVYEWGQNTLYGCGVSDVSPDCGTTHSQTLTQTVANQMNVGAGNALAVVDQAIEQEAAGMVAQNYFTLAGYTRTGGNPSLVEHLWHNTVDMGGAAAVYNASTFGNGGAFLPDPSAIALAMYNASVIGKPFPCAASGATYNFAGSNNGPLSAISNVPYLEMRCHMDSAGNRTVVIVNNDQVNSYALTFSGSGAPAGTVAVKTLAPSSLNATNEALGTAATNAFAAQVGPPTTTTVTNPASVTIAPHSIVTLSYSATVVGQLI